eukprot:CAMPEP_0113969632 /NCGR_PEP_ID=MMETSP0011_2-20120614/10476_1 /TAXON_ID=101924 /ORGANISM="Rhodosorus marinus" /LENGTH=91 /DNA_ID=CAMNT_0000983413 /DNA_START=82 /DNA_END=354 /DNA_ORIENTATION=- /assembly_acc=CAM_ASM_000156
MTNEVTGFVPSVFEIVQRRQPLTKTSVSQRPIYGRGRVNRRRSRLQMRDEDESKAKTDMFVPAFAITAIFGYALIVGYDFFKSADFGWFEW